MGPDELIVGCLQTTSKVRYGFTARHHPLFLFSPYDSKLPPMRVAAVLGGEVTTAKNVVALVRPAAPEAGSGVGCGDVAAPTTECKH